MKITREFKIGLFAVIVIIAGWAGTKFLSGIDIFSTSSDYYVEFENIDGVQKASDVVIRGVKVGSVTDIYFDPAVSENITLTLSIERRLRLPLDTRATIAGTGMMSSKCILLELGESTDYIEAEGVVMAGESRDLMSTLTSDLDLFKGRLDSLTLNLNRTLCNVNALFEASSSDLSATISNLEGITSGVNSLLAAERENLHTTIEGMATFSKGLGENSSKVDSILTSVNALCSQLSDSNVGTTLASTLTEMESSLKAINDQSGSVGKLIYDEALYANLEASTRSLDMLLTDLRENPKRYVHFSIFGSKSEGEKQQQDSIKQAKRNK